MKNQINKIFLLAAIIAIPAMSFAQYCNHFHEKYCYTSENEMFKKPTWLGKEVTGKKKYYNSNLSKKPYGIIKLLLTIVDKASVETITIEITAEKPPKKTSVAKKELPFSKGNKSV